MFGPKATEDLIATTAAEILQPIAVKYESPQATQDTSLPLDL